LGGNYANYEQKARFLKSYDTPAVLNRAQMLEQAIASLKDQQKLFPNKKYKINFEGKTIEGTAEKLIECIQLLK
jgi:alpha-N-acetylglucosamine transferase